MSLPVFINDQLDRLISDRLDLFMQGLGKQLTATTIDNDNPIERHNEAQIVVVARIFIG
jgi:hypothetical protein